MNDQEQIDLMRNIIDTLDNIREVFSKAGGLFYDTKDFDKITLDKFINTCARNGIRFYWKNDKNKIKSSTSKFFEGASIEDIINELEMQRADFHPSNKVRQYYNTVLDKLRVLQSQLINKGYEEKVNEEKVNEEKVFVMKKIPSSYKLDEEKTCCLMMKMAIESHTVYISMGNTSYAKEGDVVIGNRATVQNKLNSWSAIFDYCPWCGKKVDFI